LHAFEFVQFVAIIIVGFVTSHLLWNVVSAANGSVLGRLSRLPQE